MKACFGFNAPAGISLNNKAEQYHVLKETYKDIGWEVPRLLEMVDKSTDLYFDAAAQIHMEKWTSDRTALVGDAAYCASPMSGQGTSLALIGAYILAGELAAAKGDYRLAFENYEKELRNFVTVNQELGIVAAKVMKAQGSNGMLATLFLRLMSLAPGFMIRFLINLSTRRIKKAANSIKLKDYPV